MGLKRRVFEGVIRPALDRVGLSHASSISCRLSRYFQPVYEVSVKDQKLRFYCPNELTLWRAETFFDKEPETLEWINGFAPGECLFDVGANVGLYSLYAASQRVRVVAFEPESQNYALLNRNFMLNDMSSPHVLAFNIALSDQFSLSELNLQNTDVGSALSAFGEAQDWQGKRFSPSFRQGCVSQTLDDFVRMFTGGFPSHLKIDVDGHEEKVIRGACHTLKDQRLKSVLIELNEDIEADRQIVQMINDSGLKLLHKKRSVLLDHAIYKNVFNFIFIR